MTEYNQIWVYFIVLTLSVIGICFLKQSINFDFTNWIVSHASGQSMLYSQLDDIYDSRGKMLTFHKGFHSIQRKIGFLHSLTPLTLTYKVTKQYPL